MEKLLEGLKVEEVNGLNLEDAKDVKYIEVGYSENLFKVINVTEDGIFTHKLNKNGKESKRKYSTLIEFASVKKTYL